MQNDFSYNYSILLGRAYRTLRTSVYECLEKHDLIPTHWSLIGVVYQAGNGVKLSDVADVLGVKLPLVTIMANYLESRGLIERVANENDGRSKLLVPTKKGTKLVAVIEAELSDHLSPFLDNVSSEQLHGFRAVLQSIVDTDAAV